jgi:SHS2 domain-containing protein
MSRGHETIDHTADMGICGWGPVESDAFEETALAMFELIADGTGVSPTTSVNIEVEGNGLAELLVEFLNALLTRADIEELVFLDVETEIVSPSGSDVTYTLRARVRGIPRERVTDRLIREVKAATYCGASVQRDPEIGLVARCVVDL